MRTWRVVFGCLLVLLGIVDLVFAYWALTAASTCMAGTCGPGYHGFYYGFGVFRVLFGILALGIGSLMIVSGLRSGRGYGRWGGPGPWGGPGAFGGGPGSFAGPRRYGGPWGPGPRPPPVACASCGALNGPRFQFCRACGRPLSPGAPPGPPPPRF
jgi:hypothetical protein